MNHRLSLVFAALALSTAAFGQVVIANPGVFIDSYQVHYAANLNIGDSETNITNTGYFGGFFGAGTSGNICVNAYIFDPQEEEIGCCSCLITPNGLASLSAKSDLISNNLTPAVPTSIVIKLISSQPAAAPVTNTLTVCNPATVLTANGVVNAATLPNPRVLAPGMRAWETTLEPASTPGTYSPVMSGFLPAILSNSELNALTQVCNFIQANGTGFGICKSCRLGALGGSKK